MKNFVRNLLGIRKKRRALPTSVTPFLGASLVRGGLKMQVSEPISQELWDWLLLSGWRTNNFKGDRRSYVKLPENTLRTLMSADQNERENLHADLLRRANRTTGSK